MLYYVILFFICLLDVILNIYKKAMSVLFMKSSYFSTVEHHVTTETLNVLAKMSMHKVQPEHSNVSNLHPCLRIQVHNKLYLL